MTATKETATVELKEPGGHVSGELRISLLPGKRSDTEPPLLLDYTHDVGHDLALAPIQLLEGKEYRYHLQVDAEAGNVQIEPKELFLPDDDTARTGRLRPRLCTGTVRVTVWSGDRELLCGEFEVRSRKLGYLTEYQWMMRDIAKVLTELVINRFAPSRQRFTPAAAGDAETLYQRFAFLQSAVLGDGLDAAMSQILARPHRKWVEEVEVRPPGRLVAPTSHLVRQLTMPGPRVPFDRIAGLESIPAQLGHQRTDETLDTPENRFIKFALTSWRQLVFEIGAALRKEKANSPVERGLREVEAVARRLDEYLAADMFREVGEMTHLPAGSQVLQKRAGYRDMLRQFLQGDLAASLAWEGGEDVYSAGQRNVATLYEYWVFLQLALEVERLCGGSFDLSRLVELRSDRMHFVIRRGEEMKPFTGQVVRLGRNIELALYFNHSFTRDSKSSISWTRKLTPDCSLELKVDADTPKEKVVWLHFDAKYKIDHLDQIFVAEDTSDDDDADEPEAFGIDASAQPADLLKMHAYRDAIRRSAGAYVLYPGGGDPVKLQQYHELLPGLGAFALRPSEEGDVRGVEALRTFLEDVMMHVASQVTQDERVRHWVDEATRDPSKVCPPVQVAPFLTKPPADVPVLVGFVRNVRHLEWIHRTGRYNLRTDSRPGSVTPFGAELAAEVVVLHSAFMPQVEIWTVGGPAELWTHEAMVRAKYPGEADERYFCLHLGERVKTEWEHILTKQWINSLRRRLHPDESFRFGLPFSTTWLELVRPFV